MAIAFHNSADALILCAFALLVQSTVEFNLNSANEARISHIKSRSSTGACIFMFVLQMFVQNMSISFNNGNSEVMNRKCQS